MAYDTHTSVDQAQRMLGLMYEWIHTDSKQEGKAAGHQAVCISSR
jgi:hypothetical protein